MQQNRIPRPEDHKRMTIFFVLAAIIMSLAFFFITIPAMKHAQQMRIAAAQQQAAAATASVQVAPITQSIEKVLATGKRLDIDNADLHGSFAATGLRFDDVELKNYYATLEKTNLVRLLAPTATKDSYFVEVGLLPAADTVKVPTNDTPWMVTNGATLTPQTPLTLEWNNGAGIVFRRVVSIDDQYVVTVQQNVINNTDRDVVLYPYALVSQSHHVPQKGEVINFEDRDSAVQHVGPIGYLGDALQEVHYNDFKPDTGWIRRFINWITSTPVDTQDRVFTYPNTNGWLGLTGKYWLVSLLPQPDQVFDARFAHQTGSEGQDIYQADLRLKPMSIAAHQTAGVPMRFFAGAKKLSIIDGYERDLQIKKFELAIDFGRLYIITKPLYHFLSFLGNYYHETLHVTASFGLALLTLTVLIRLVMFPLQNKSYRSMNRMKDIHPKINALKEQYADDKVKFQQEVMTLYKRERVNPAAGCLPIFIQIPIFFSLYKVIYITLDMRHAPFFGWVHDLSAPDPTNIFNLFGLLPFQPPALLAIGAWPLLYGITMWAQQKLNPKPEDPTQQQVFALLPWVFTFIFAKLPAGLVIYYTWSNFLGVIQQYSVRKLNPVPPKSDVE